MLADVEKYLNLCDSSTSTTEEIKAAFSELKNSPEPMVVWLVTHVENFHREELRRVLRELPLTLPEFDRMARQYDWCEAYWGCHCGDSSPLHNDGYRGLMIDAGLFPTATEEEKAQTQASV